MLVMNIHIRTRLASAFQARTVIIYCVALLAMHFVPWLSYLRLTLNVCYIFRMAQATEVVTTFAIMSTTR
jgi:hypothetical protein